MYLCKQYKNRVAIIYQNNNTGYPEAIIGEVSGSSITFGTPQQITTDYSYRNIRATYDPSADRLVMFVGYSSNYYGYVGSINVMEQIVHRGEVHS